MYGIDLVDVPLHEGVSFELEHPALIHGVKVYFAQLPDGPANTPIPLGIYEDFGSNGFDYTWWQSDWEGDLCLGDITTDAWQPYVLSEPLPVDAGLVHVAHLRQGAADTAWAMDTANSPADCGPESACHSSVHLPEHTVGDDYYAWNGLSFPIEEHYSVRLLVEYVDVIPDEQRIFQPVPGSIESIRTSWGDYDGDGDDDLLLAGPQLLRNDGGTFVDANGSSGLAGMPTVQGGGGVFGDYDNDGCLDLFIYKGSTLMGDHLLHNECDGSFTDVTVVSGIADAQAYSDCSEFDVPTSSATWWDIDSDGLLDLYVANRECWADGVYYVDLVWHNEGGGVFSDWTGTNGFLGFSDAPTASTSSVAADGDGDGDADLYVSNHRHQPNLYFRNEGGAVSEVAADIGVQGEPVTFQTETYYGQSRSATWADIDTDGDFDLIQVNLAHQRTFDFSDKTQVLLNDGGGNFGDAQGSWGTPWSNLGIRYVERGWTPVLQDFDSDGALDLMISAARGQPTEFYWGRGGGSYIHATYAAGIRPHDAALAAADFDLDGDVDVVTGDRIYANAAEQGAWVSVGLVGNVASNRSAIGATLRGYVGDAVLLRFISGGNGQQDSLYQHLGLADADQVDRFEVDFPGGGTVSYEGPFAAGQRWWLLEDGSTAAGWAPPAE